MRPAVLKESFVISIVFWIVGLSIVGGVHTLIGFHGTSSFPDISADRWQAVFLQGGQVYFGKLADSRGDYVMLSDVYYLKEASDLAQSNLNLVKLGGELHGPEDIMYIRKQSITYWENMKDTSRVVQSIEGSKQ